MMMLVFDLCLINPCSLYPAKEVVTQWVGNESILPFPMEAKGGAKIALPAPAKICLEPSQLERKKRLEIIDIDLEGASPFSKDTTRIFPKRSHPLRICLEKRPIPMLLKTRAAQWGIILHIVSQVPHDIPLKPRRPVDIGGVRVFIRHAFPKNAVFIIT